MRGLAFTAIVWFIGCAKTPTASKRIEPRSPEPKTHFPESSASVAETKSESPFASPSLLNADGHCDLQSISPTSARACLCGDRTSCVVETMVPIDPFRSLASMVLGTETPGDVKSELWLLRQQGDVLGLQLLGLYDAHGLEGKTPARSWDELSFSSGVITWSASHAWREAHDSNFTSHVRFGLDLDDLRPSIERWDWRRCCDLVEGTLIGYGFDTVCQQHTRTDPWRLAQTEDYVLQGKSCRSYRTRSIPEVHLPTFTASRWRDTGLGTCALWSTLSAPTATRVGVLWSSESTFVVELVRAASSSAKWGTLEILSGGSDFESPDDLGESVRVDAEGQVAGPKGNVLGVDIELLGQGRRFRVKTHGSYWPTTIVYREGAASVSTSDHKSVKGRPLSRSLSHSVSSPRVGCETVDGSLALTVHAPNWNEPLFVE